MQPDSIRYFNEAQRDAIQKRISLSPCYRRIYISKWPEIVLSTRKLTASYVSEAMQELDAAVKENNLVFMNEIGLDPD
jgi:hypothetical protein